MIFFFADLLFPLPKGYDEWTKVITTVVVTLGAAGALYQYAKGTRLKAADTLLKLEEEFREVCATYGEIDYLPSYEESIHPVLKVVLGDDTRELTEAGVEKLAEIDRCLRFLYLCSVVNDTLRADHAFRVAGGVVPRAYYYYLGILLPAELAKRRKLDKYTDKYYPRLRAWVKRKEAKLLAAREPAGEWRMFK